MKFCMDKSNITVTVCDVRWERIQLYIDVDITGDTCPAKELEFFAVNEFGQACFKFHTRELEYGKLCLHVNITNIGDKTCVPRGVYTIYACRGEEVLAECMTSPDIAPKLADFSRGFAHGNQTKYFNVTFYIDDDAEKLPFRIHAMNSNAAGMDFPTTPLFRNRIKVFKAIKDCFLSIRPIIRRVYKLECKIYKKKRKNTVLFMTEQNDKLVSNLKAVWDRMTERGLDKEFVMLQSARKPDGGNSPKSWIKLVKYLAQSGTVFIDDHAPVLDWLKLTDDTRLIQMWHAGAGFKSSGYSRWGNTGCPAPQSCHRQYTYGIAGSKNIAPFFSEVWGINDEAVLPTGMPRMDEYLDPKHQEEKRKEIYDKYPMCRDKKVILFAPTYRGKNQIDAYYPYELLDMDRLYEVCGDKYVVMFKMHPWVSKDIKIDKKYQDRFISVLKYPNINDLFYVVDLLITDYSSNIFEYSLMRKPMLFFAYDKIQYSFSRGFHRPYEESAPGKVCYTFDEVLEAIRTEDFEYEKVEQYIEHHFDHIDSNASDRVIDWILLDKLPQEIKDDIAKVDADMKRLPKLDFTIPGKTLDLELKKW